MKYYLLLICALFISSLGFSNHSKLEKLNPIELQINANFKNSDLEANKAQAIKEAENIIAGSEWFAGVDYSEEWAATGNAAPPAVDETAKANALHDWVKRENRIIQLFQPTRRYNLPVGIVANVGGIEFMVIIDSLVYTPRGAEMTTYMSMEVPFSENRIAFKGDNIQFTKRGIQRARMRALKDYTLNISSQTSLVIKQSESYIEFDCNGYKETTISANINVDRKILLPLSDNGTVIPAPKKVSANFKTTFYDWNDLILEVNVTPFQVKGLDGFQFRVSKAVFDLSDYQNCAGMVFPAGYSNPDISGGISMWRGFYLESLEVTIPKEFGNNIKLSANNMLIDGTGLSGTFTALNLIPINQGNLSGWDFSLDYISATLLSNQVNKIEFKGKIKVPLEENSNTAFDYNGSISNEGDYLLDVKLSSTVNMDLWLAKLRLDPGSNVIVERTEGKLRPKAILSGNMRIGENSEEKLSVGIDFEELKIQTINPKLSIGKVSFTDDTQNRFKNFPIMINNLEFKNASENRSGLAFEVILNFMDGESGFGANGGFTIWGQEYTTNNKTKWRYKNIQVNSFSLAISTTAFEFEGSLTLYDEDATYGNGFKGKISAWFNPGFTVEATAQFGNVNGYRYWYVDATVSLPAGIMIYPAFGIYGFGGGAYYHMKQTNLPTQIKDGPSKVKYVPNRNIALGIKAKVIVGTWPNPTAFNGDASFEISFYEGGGVSRIRFKGNAYFLKTLNPTKDWSTGNSSPIGASLDIDLNFEENSFHGVFTVYMDVAGIIEGVGNKKEAGSVVMHFSEEKWYINIGTPTSRVGIKILDLFRIDGYLMVGDDIPGMPPLPPEVRNIVYNNTRDQVQLKTGKGFAFGASASFDTGDITFLIFYARLSAGVGFDFMLRNLGKDTHCEGRSNPVGIGGWYAEGRFYAYVHAAIGIKIKLFGIRKKFSILDLSVAIVLNAKLPNPSWVEGIVAARYRILGGLIKGHCRFKFELGEKCIFTDDNSVDGISVISEVSPFNGAKDVSVYTKPQVAFNMQLNYEFEFMELDGTRNTYIIRLDHFDVKNNNQSIRGNLEWSSDGLVCAFKSHEILPPNKDIYIEARVHFEKKVNGRWQTVYQNGSPAYEMRSATFRTGDAPTTIQESNIAYAYPFSGQAHFYPDEANHGYIVLDRGRKDLFQSYNGWPQKAVFRAGGKKQVNLSYNENTKTVSFAIPGGLSTGKRASLSLAHIAPGGNNSGVSSNVSKVEDKRSEAEIVTTQDIEGTITETKDKEIYSCEFNTSNYRTLRAKINRFGKYSTFNNVPGEIAFFDLFMVFSGSEYFSEYEINGSNRFNPLIQLSAKTNNAWLNRFVIPNMYDGYNRYGFNITWRRPVNEYGVPPLKAVKIMNNQRNIIKYYLSQVVGLDQNELRTQAHQKWVNGIRDNYIKNLAESDLYLIFVRSKYNIDVNYILPGKNNANSTTNVQIDY